MHSTQKCKKKLSNVYVLYARPYNCFFWHIHHILTLQCILGLCFLWTIHAMLLFDSQTFSVLFVRCLWLWNSLHIIAFTHNALECYLFRKLTSFRSRTFSFMLMNEYKYTMSSNMLNQPQSEKCVCVPYLRSAE